METYFDVYVKRMQKANELLLELAEELTSKGFEVLIPKSETRVNYMKIIKDGLTTYTGFDDVPYRWWLDGECSSHRKTYGSYCRIADMEYPFSVDEILESMRGEPKKRADFYRSIYATYEEYKSLRQKEVSL